MYKIAPSTVIVTGYRPFGNCKPSYELCRKYDLEAEKIIEATRPDYENRVAKLEVLIQKFLKEVLENENG